MIYRESRVLINENKVWSSTFTSYMIKLVPPLSKRILYAQGTFPTESWVAASQIASPCRLMKPCDSDSGQTLTIDAILWKKSHVLNTCCKKRARIAAKCAGFIRKPWSIY